MDYTPIIENLKLEEAKTGTDLQDVLAIVQRTYEKGLLVELHSHQDETGVRFSVHLILQVPETGATVIKIVHSDGTVDDWHVIEPLK